MLDISEQACKGVGGSTSLKSWGGHPSLLLTPHNHSPAPQIAKTGAP